MIYCAWFAGGLRVVDVADPSSPREMGFFIPHPAEGLAAPQTNDVFVDERQRIYMVDHYVGLDILEHTVS